VAVVVAVVVAVAVAAAAAAAVVAAAGVAETNLDVALLTSAARCGAVREGSLAAFFDLSGRTGAAPGHRAHTYGRARARL